MARTSNFRQASVTSDFSRTTTYCSSINSLAIFKIGNGEPGNQGTGEPGNRETREQGNRGTREPGRENWGIGNKEIKKPPDSPPDDLVVVYRDKQLRASFIREKYPSFVGKELIVTPEIHTHLRVKHIRRLVDEFNLV